MAMEPEIVADILRKVSLASQVYRDKKKSVEETKYREAQKGEPPSDRFYLVHIMIMLTGLMQFMPASFFTTANDYWMYKFRNTSMETVDSKNRNSMQAFFISWTSIVSTIPSVGSIILSTFYGHKVIIRKRLLLTLFIVFCCFLVFTGFIKINTDTWQFGFFCLTMAVIVIIHATMSFFHASSMVLISKFPPHFTQFYLYGEGASGLFSAIMQIISLAIGPSSETAALIYFSVGTFMIMITYLLIAFSKYLPLVQYYMDNSYEDTKRPVYKLSEMLATLKQIWPCVTILCIMLFDRVATYPNISNLIVSENNGNGEPWADKYFVPCITFLLAGVASIVGRVLAAPLRVKKSTAWIWIAAIIARTSVAIPVMMLCNAQPRHHLPVVFGHDWEYIVIVIVSSLTSGGIFNILFVSMQEFAAGNEELAYLSMITFMAIYHACISPLGLLFVKLL